jgi:hypothetical protein
MLERLGNRLKRERAGGLVSRLRQRLPRVGLAGGGVAGALYAAQSSQHMIVDGTYDKLVVGALLSLLLALAGWLAGVILLSSLRDEEDRSRAAHAGTSEPREAAPQSGKCGRNT